MYFQGGKCVSKMGGWEVPQSGNSIKILAKLAN
jgi:hypothetical protein